MALFIYEKCPICINYTRTINKIKSEYKNQIELIGVFPNQLSNEESISQFTSKFELEFDEDFWQTEIVDN